MTKLRRLRLGMVGGGEGAFIGAVHRMASRIDDQYEFVAGALASDPERARASGRTLGLAEDRCYEDYAEMARAEAMRRDRIDVVSIVTPNYLHHRIARCFLDAGFHVVCDKPLTTSLPDALDLVAAVEASDRVFAVTYNYSGYPMARQAREMVAAGEIGDVRVVQVEYAQGWLTDKLEDTGFKQAVWRTDPELSGPAGCLGDIGTHALHLAEFVLGLQVVEVAADLEIFVEGRRLDDNVHVLLRCSNGAKGMLWASQIAPGHENGLRLRVYGSKGALIWSQEDPNYLGFARHGGAPQRLTRAGPGAGRAAAYATRIPGGHPEGYLEAFAQIYKDAAELIRAKQEARQPDPRARLTPTVIDGARGVKFVEAAIESNRANGAWTSALL